VKEFDAYRLIQAIRIAIDCSHLAAAANLGDSPVNTTLLTTIKPMVIELLECCKKEGLRMSVLSLERNVAFFDSKLRSTLIAESLIDAVKRSVMVIEDELSLRAFFVLEPHEVTLYKTPWDGWESIVKQFEETGRDIEEMNKCFALGRYSASMFHALHVAEWGAIRLGDYIGVTDPKKGWGATRSRLAELVKGGHSKLPSGLSGKWDFIEQMSREIDSLALAWRHKVDHAANHPAIVPNSDFTPDIAEHIIGAIRVFMLRLVEECA